MVVFIVLVVLTLLAVSVMIVSSRSRKPVEIPETISLVSKPCRDMAARVDALRADYVKLDPEMGEEMPEAALEPARTLMEERRRWVNACAAGQDGDDFFDRLKSRYESTLSSALMKQSREEELAARNALSERDYAAALRHASIALRLQKQINDEHPASRYAQIPREALLDRLIMDATYTPLVRQFQDLKARADGYFYSNDYDAALRDYTQLLQVLRDMAPQLPPSYMDVDDRIRIVTSRREEVGARIRDRALQEQIASANDAAARGDWDAAGAACVKAMEIQRSISSDYPSSTLAGTHRLDQLDAGRQNLMSRPLMQRINDGIAQIDADLASGSEDSLQAVLAATNLAVSDMTRMFPKADALKGEAFERVPYLFGIRSDIVFLRRAIVEHLRPVAGRPGWSFLDREVSQLLFQRIMGYNPSARKQDNLPVDNVTLEDARAFARRITWIVGLETRIPDLSAYSAAIGSPDVGYVRSSTWNSATAQGRELQPVATSKADAGGFHDLLGNASEWVDTERSDATQTIVIGGNVRDNPIRLSEVPKDPHDINERIRNNGFRIMVKTGGK